jgi:CheY-specific phosphatase CheX
VNLQVDPVLLDVIIKGTAAGLQLTDVVPVPVGASRLASARHGMSVIVGLVGKSSGSVMMNFAEAGLFHLAELMLGEPQNELSEDNIDAMMEIGNIVAGAIKDHLAGTEMEVREISLPSLVLGQSYAMVYARGITTVSVEFELPGVPASKLYERYFSTTISLMRRSGGG